MPTGTMKWFDPRGENGRVAHGGTEYPILPGETDRDAQTPKARVHFDIRRRDGVDWAINVHLCRGTRVHRLQHRFGDLVGRHSHAAPGERSPSTLVALWLQALAHGDTNAASLLYAPDACVHAGDTTIHGRDHIRAYLTQDPIATRSFAATEVHAPDDRTVVVAFQPGDDGSRETRLRVERGEIVEQWL